MKVKQLIALLQMDFGRLLDYDVTINAEGKTDDMYESDISIDDRNKRIEFKCEL